MGITRCGAGWSAKSARAKFSSAANILELQKFLREQKSRGVLLALASKNEEADVAAVFDRRRWFCAAKISWRGKLIGNLSRKISLRWPKSLSWGSIVLFFSMTTRWNARMCRATARRSPPCLLPAAGTERIIEISAACLGCSMAAGATAVDEKRTELYREQGERNRFQDRRYLFPRLHRRLKSSSQQSSRQCQRITTALAQLTPAHQSIQFDRNPSADQRNSLHCWNPASDACCWSAHEIASAITDKSVWLLLIDRRPAAGDRKYFDELPRAGQRRRAPVLAAIGREAQRLGAEEVVTPFIRTERNQPAENFFNSIGTEKSPMAHFA